MTSGSVCSLEKMLDSLIDSLIDTDADKVKYRYEIKKDGKLYEFTYSLTKIKGVENE